MGDFPKMEGVGTTVVHPIGLCMLVICGAMLVFLPRRYAIWGFIILVCFVSTRQSIAIGGFNLYFPRVMVLVFGVLRGVLRGEIATFRRNRLDVLVISFGVWYFLAGSIAHDFSVTFMKTCSGYDTELIGTYLLFRMILRDIDDVKMAVLGLALVSVPLLFFFLVEYTTARNVFSIFGGVPEFAFIREGRLRCQGAFGHPILAGVFWATMLPLIIAGIKGRWESKAYYVFGTVACLGIVILTASSTPVLGVVAGLCGWSVFRWRHHSRRVFAAVGMLLVVLHLVMEAPVWSLIQRINITSGNSGYHRYLLVDGFINHANEWWMFGSHVGTAHWGHFTFDTANEYVVVGVGSGLVGLMLFIAIIVVAMNASGRLQAESPELGWGLGLSIFTISLCFFGISIWGQLHFAWSFPIAMAGSLGFQPVTSSSAVPPNVLHFKEARSERQVNPFHLAGKNARDNVKKGVHS